MPLRRVVAALAVVALAASGLPVNAFHFLGFPPRTAGQRRAFFSAARSIEATLVLYEAPHRLPAAITDALAVLGDRPACLARNLTKPHERYQRGTLSALRDALTTEGEVRGETTLLIAGAAPDQEREERRDAASDDALHMLAEGDVDPRPLITGEVGLDGVEQAFTALGDPEAHAKILVDPQRAGGL